MVGAEEFKPKRSLLVAVDDPKTSLHALKWVVDEMYQDGDEIVLYHVVPWATPWTYADRHVELELRETKGLKKMMDDYASVVDPKLNAELEERNVKWRFIVEASRSNQPHDLPAQLIVNKAKSIDTCKALIVARSNKSKLAEFFVGSVTSEVIKRSQVPVLVFNE